MFPRILPLTLAACLTFAATASAATSEPSPAELDALRKTLADIRTKQESSRSAALSQSLAQLSAATGSPLAAVNAYVSAVEIADFGDKPGASGDFRDWKQANSDILARPSLRTAAILHLKYLALTLKQAQAPDQPVDLDAVVSYVREAAEAKAIYAQPNDDRLEGNERKQLRERIKSLTEQPLPGGPFSRAYNLGPLFDGVKNWEMAPGNVEGILNTTVRPLLREKKDPRLLETWDLQIEVERGLAEDWEREQPESKLNSDRLPRLAWNRAKDQLAIGDRAGGLQAMLRIIQSNPSHPEQLKWIDQLSEEVAPVAPTETPAAPEAQGAPPAQATE